VCDQDIDIHVLSTVTRTSLVPLFCVNENFEHLEGLCAPVWVDIFTLQGLLKPRCDQMFKLKLRQPFSF